MGHDVMCLLSVHQAWSAFNKPGATPAGAELGDHAPPASSTLLEKQLQGPAARGGGCEEGLLFAVKGC